jgi:prepilin-type N-terminal cleavage/methylation domain-containing protein
MTRRNRGPRAGFTLVEILIVIAIIALLVAMLLPAIGKVREGARRSECATDMAQVASAVQAFKTKFNVNFIPPSFSMEPDYTDAGSDAASLLYLKSIFPFINEKATGLPPATLDGNQTLLFFLTGGVQTNYQGFSTNKQKPFNLTTGSSTIGPFLVVKDTKVAVDPTNLQARYLDPWGTPYAYFTHIPTSGVGTYAGTFTWPDEDGNNLTVTPYSQSGKYLNAKSFQIISAGANRAFGPGGTNWTPGSGLYDALGIGGDDMSNFNNGPLAAQE